MIDITDVIIVVLPAIEDALAFVTFLGLNRLVGLVTLPDIGTEPGHLLRPTVPAHESERDAVAILLPPDAARLNLHHLLTDANVIALHGHSPFGLAEGLSPLAPFLYYSVRGFERKYSDRKCRNTKSDLDNIYSGIILLRHFLFNRKHESRPEGRLNSRKTTF